MSVQRDRHGNQREPGPISGRILDEVQRVGAEREARGLTLQEEEVPSRQGGALAEAAAEEQFTKAAATIAEDPTIFTLDSPEHADQVRPLREAHSRLLKAWRAETGRNPGHSDVAFWKAFNRVIAVWNDGIREGS